ncbi:MAG: metal ABC transporter substrate-binding protein [Anaerolineae bacterium]|nr:metal ABC transporter substrate-binding protein [Anaerolineae bacterium]
MTIRNHLLFLAAVSVLLAGLYACRPATAPTPGSNPRPALAPVHLAAGESLRVVATTSIVADVVANVGGDRIALTTLVPLGADPHSFQPTPQDMAALAKAHVVFANGAGLETFLESLMDSVGIGDRLVYVSEGVALLEAAHEHEGEAGHEGGDPHTWFDPNNVMVWARNIRDTLSALDPVNAAVYQTNAQAYIARLEELDAWIRREVARIPPDSRKLVTDHATFTYFAARYGFEQVGAIFPGYSTLASPSAQELAALEDVIRAQGVKAVFVGKSVNPALAERVAQDTGVRLVFLYTGSLGGAGSPASTYLDMMRYNVSAIVDALR